MNYPGKPMPPALKTKVSPVRPQEMFCRRLEARLDALDTQLEAWVGRALRLSGETELGLAAPLAELRSQRLALRQELAEIRAAEGDALEPLLERAARTWSELEQTGAAFARAVDQLDELAR